MMTLDRQTMMSVPMMTPPMMGGVGVNAMTGAPAVNIAQQLRSMVSRSLSIQPTITIRPGFPVRVMVTHDLVLEPYRA